MILYDKSKDTVHWGSSVSVPSSYLGAWSRAAELYYSHTFYCLAPSGGSHPFSHHTILGFAPFLAFLIFNLAIFACFWPLVGPEGRGQIFILWINAFASASIITEDHKVWTVMKSSIFGQTFHFFPQTTYQHIIMMYFNISLNIEYRHTCIFKKHIGERKVWDF